ncbi:hypothetical protein GCM10022223_16110 [Kineosporia mesophila]|uniref:Amidohydrolase-related domain-containing protein n=1 Tax=Kineosporia mesophila TaxID=566012 RepID=A0ABP6Z9H5_9ACTN|nr:amidohydrolase family protein [Kineosporia mesophila]MCD5354902.1 amidohydrolase [Kineosporia mesophila]
MPGDLLVLANVSVKVSGIRTLSRCPDHYPGLWPHLERVLEAFGADRCLWGTDHLRVAGRLPGLGPVPPCPGRHSCAEGLHYRLDRDELSAAKKTALFAGTARRILGRQ